MKTLNEIAENIAYKLGQQFNYTLRESIKLTVLDYRAKYIRDSIDRGYLSELHFAQPLIIEFEKVNLLEEFSMIPDCLNGLQLDDTPPSEYDILKSKEPIPTPIRVYSSHIQPFIYVGNAIGTKPFVYTTLEKYQYIKDLKFQDKVIYYIIYNHHIYIINNLNACDINNTIENICKGMVRGIFENPRELYPICLTSGKFKDDNPFPCSRDIVFSISNAIVKGEYSLIPSDGKIVNIDTDGTDTGAAPR